MQILSDGTLILTYMILEADLNMPPARKSFVYGTTRSAGRGRSWEPPLWLGPANGGRESVLTAYTTRRHWGLDKTEDELYSGVVRWQVPE